MIENSPIRRIGIIGGTFNPVHLGHLLLAESALDQFGLDQVIWVPTYRPPHKNQPLPAFAHRWEMVQWAIADHPQFIASNIEQKRRTTSYANETFAELKTTFPEAAHWHWIVGLDAFQSLPAWRNSTELAPQCTWLVAPRKHGSIEQICLGIEREFATKSVQLRWHTIKLPQINISSSLIRRQCQLGRSLRYLVPESVRVYISTNNLYPDGKSEELGVGN
ncbi:MAG: nicotinate (nicotinamide) nucleotide adenylyltransferase [Leptolyngbyaceae cyanobacterium bins.302]|nr:nicotinate (nicotinamide) nucleotide adenylyltransferase [Leptolyngbyaceae cyanobacterium bins.302]